MVVNNPQKKQDIEDKTQIFLNQIDVKTISIIKEIGNATINVSHGLTRLVASSKIK